MYQSLVWFHEKEENPLECMEDLNLDQVISFITNHYEEYQLGEYYDRLPSAKTRKWREEILKDVRDTKVYASMKEFLSVYKILLERTQYERQCKYRFQALKLELDNGKMYCDLLRDLEQCLKEEPIQSEGLHKLLEWLQKEIFDESFLKMESEIQTMESEFSGLKFSLCYEGIRSTRQSFGKDKKETVRMITDTDEARKLFEQENYQDKIAEKLSISDMAALKENHPFQDTKELNELERIILKLLCKEYPKPFEQLQKSSLELMNSYYEKVNEMVREFAFYISFVEFAKSMESIGYQLTACGNNRDEFKIVNGYDLALVLSYLEKDKKVVANSCEYLDKERFFVVTGPNQGGKTTFARMLGQQVYFAQMGLLVPASAAVIPNFTQISSHFASEEAEEIGAGKLKEELLRLAPILENIQKNEDLRTFVIINELFTTAATYDAVIMGHRVMDYLCAANCYGVYVTHVRELAEGKEEAVSLTAEVENDEARTRTYHITRNPSSLGQAQSVAYKYGLTYEQMRRRMLP